jgi:hypothetical protein
VHRLTRDLERRLEAIERQLARLPERLTPEEQARKEARLLNLCRAAVEDRDPDLELTTGEAELLEKMRRYAPTFQELINEGIIGPYGEPSTPAAGRDGGHEEPGWQP